MYKIDEEEFPYEMRLKVCAGTLNKYLALYSVGMYEKFGEEGLKLIEKIWSDMAEKNFPKSFEKMGFKGNGPKELAEWFAKADALIGYPTDFFVISENKAGFRITKCPWFNKPHPAGEKICCNGATGGYERKAAQLLNPKIKFYMTKNFHKGDNFCEFIFEIQEETDNK